MAAGHGQVVDGQPADGVYRQGDLFAQATVSDYLFDRDKIYAYVTLDDNELFIYQRLFDLLVRDIAAPDVVVYLQAPADVVFRRVKQGGKTHPERPLPDQAFVRELSDAYNHFFFHYTATPLLVVETSQVEPDWPDAAVDEILRQIQGMTGGTRYYVPRLEH